MVWSCHSGPLYMDQESREVPSKELRLLKVDRKWFQIYLLLSNKKACVKPVEI